MSASEQVVFDPFGDVLLLLKPAPEPVEEAESKGKGKGADNDDNQKDTKEKQDHDSNCTVVPSPGPDGYIKARVSSSHLALASRVFRAMFHGSFREGVK